MTSARSNTAANKKFVLWLVELENIRKFNKLKFG